MLCAALVAISRCCSSFVVFGLGVGILQLQYIIAMRCRVILGFQVAAAMLHVVKLRFFVVGGGAQIGRIVVVLVALGVSRAVLAC